ncbi:MAG: hypothetical protein RIE73_03630 [Coleofasciculus sp. C1-SOL-03]|uniref:hypothetical protein n=1 Tax=Coleofasciculus sp. C1-SOL-03 TaxID=3069522 RepID=UPI0032FB3FF8
MNENDNHLGDDPRVSWLSLILKYSPQISTPSGHKVLGAACDRVEEAGDSNPLSGMGCGERQSGGREAHAITQLKGIENIALETLIQTKHRAIKQEKRRQKNPEKSHREGISILGLSGMASVRTFWSFCKNLNKNVCILW